MLKTTHALLLLVAPLLLASPALAWEDYVYDDYIGSGHPGIKGPAAGASMGGFFMQAFGLTTEIEDNEAKNEEWRKHQAGEYKAEQERLKIAATLNAGFEGNIYGEPEQSKDSLFLGADLRAELDISSSWRVAFGTKQHYYEDAPLSKEGADDYWHNYHLSSYFTHNITPDLQLSNTTEVNYGGIGGLQYGDISNGVLETNRTVLKTSTSLSYGDATYQSGPSTGLFHNSRVRLGLRTDLYNQSGEDSLDTDEHRVGLQFTRHINPRLSFFGGVSHRTRDWRDRDFDSDGYIFEAGARGSFPCGAEYRLSINHESRNYDNPALDDRDVLGYSLLINGQVNAYKWGVFSEYGFMDPNLPRANRLRFADAEGQRFGSYVSRDFGDGFNLILYCYGLFLDGEIFDGADDEHTYTYTGIQVSKKLTDGATIGANIGYSTVNYDFSGNREREEAPSIGFYWRKDL